MIGQKDAVVAQVKAYLGNSFTPYKDIALILLTNELLETLKGRIADMIIAGEVEYSKDKTNVAEVRAYTRSMCMNHLKKCRELNGNVIYGGGTAVAAKEPRNHFPLNKDLLTQELKDYLETL